MPSSAPRASRRKPPGSFHRGKTEVEQAFGLGSSEERDKMGLRWTIQVLLNEPCDLDFFRLGSFSEPEINRQNNACLLASQEVKGE